MKVLNSTNFVRIYPKRVDHHLIGIIVLTTGQSCSGIIVNINKHEFGILWDDGQYMYEYGERNFPDNFTYWRYIGP